MKAEKARELTKSADDAKRCFPDIKHWFIEQIKRNAKDSMRGCRVNLIEKKSYFDNKEGTWKEEPQNWIYIADLLEQDMLKLGYNFNRAIPRDFHVTW